ncbi:hypothetical protein NCC49_000676 [Naganishia albida]|nr:hypothetical protein NCC49_000676 [Naganishia albida]
MTTPSEPSTSTQALKGKDKAVNEASKSSASTSSMWIEANSLQSVKLSTPRIQCLNVIAPEIETLTINGRAVKLPKEAMNGKRPAKQHKDDIDT